MNFWKYEKELSCSRFEKKFPKVSELNKYEHKNIQCLQDRGWKIIYGVQNKERPRTAL